MCVQIAFKPPVAYAAVGSVVVDLLFSVHPIVCWSSVFVIDLLSITLYAHYSFAIILKRKNKLFALLLLSYRCLVTVNVLWLFLKVPWVGLQCVIVVFPDHTHLLFHSLKCCEPVYTYFAFCLSLFVSIADDVNICRNTITIIIKLT